jgi:hypothetical protein
MSRAADAAGGGLMEFTKSNGTKPSTQARRYVYRIVAELLDGDIANGSEWMWREFDEADSRRIMNATKKIIAEMRRKAGATRGEVK